MNGRHHKSLTTEIGKRIFSEECAIQIGSWADYPDRVYDVSVDGVGTEMWGHAFCSLTHFCVPCGATSFRGYAWKMDPTIPHLNLPNRTVHAAASAWVECFGDIPPAKHPEAILLETPGYSKAADETTYATGAVMAGWLGTSQRPNRSVAGASCHFVEDACIREHDEGALLGRHSVREAKAETWWFKHLGSKRLEAMLDVAKVPGPMYPRQAVEECCRDTLHKRDPWCRPYSDGQMVKMHQRAIWYTARLLWWWAERGVA